MGHIKVWCQWLRKTFSLSSQDAQIRNNWTARVWVWGPQNLLITAILGIWHPTLAHALCNCDNFFYSFRHNNDTF